MKRFARTLALAVGVLMLALAGPAFAKPVSYLLSTPGVV